MEISTVISRLPIWDDTRLDAVTASFPTFSGRRRDNAISSFDNGPTSYTTLLREGKNGLVKLVTITSIIISMDLNPLKSTWSERWIANGNL